MILISWNWESHKTIKWKLKWNITLGYTVTSRCFPKDFFLFFALSFDPNGNIHKKWFEIDTVFKVLIQYFSVQQSCLLIIFPDDRYYWSYFNKYCLCTIIALFCIFSCNKIVVIVFIDLYFSTFLQYLKTVSTTFFLFNNIHIVEDIRLSD